MKDSLASGIASNRLFLCAILVLLALAAYSNSFQNDFHFDDWNTIQQNPAIRDSETIWRAFLNTDLFSAKVSQRVYRPILLSSLALDAWLGNGLDLFYFHLSTFLWLCVQLILMFLLFERLLNLASPHPSNLWTAWAAAAIFGAHPACAETVNYVIQRADLYNALGCVAGIWFYARYPAQRKFGWYLLPVFAAILAKPPALVFPALLLVYVLLFETKETEGGWQRLAGALRAIVPALAVAAACGYLLARMQPPTWQNGAASPLGYWLTQPYVAWHYFKSFFLPTELSIDEGWKYLPPLGVKAIGGYLFVAGLLAATIAACRRRMTMPIGFGLCWFAIALLPTSLQPLSDVTNDHRMFFPFVGLTLAVCWGVRLLLFRLTANLARNPACAYGTAMALAAILNIGILGTRERNRVWHTEESVWRDATIKNPDNPKAWVNYAVCLMRTGNDEGAAPYLNRALALDPSNVSAHFNLVNAMVRLHRDGEAEIHFKRLLELPGPGADPYIAYADWLRNQGRISDSGALLARASGLYPPSNELRHAWLLYYVARDAAGHIAAIRAIDTDHDTVISAGELLGAGSALRALDRDGDGQLSPEECGVPRADLNSEPVWRALDANHDGVISAAEMENAPRELATLDANGNDRLEPEEYVPQYVADAARRILAQLDQDHDGRIDARERVGEAAAAFRDLLNAADVDGDGAVTLSELTNEIFYRADSAKTGVVTPQDWSRAVNSGVLGPVPLIAARGSTSSHPGRL